MSEWLPDRLVGETEGVTVTKENSFFPDNAFCHYHFLLPYSVTLVPLGDLILATYQFLQQQALRTMLGACLEVACEHLSILIIRPAGLWYEALGLVLYPTLSDNRGQRSRLGSGHALYLPLCSKMASRRPHLVLILKTNSFDRRSQNRTEYN